MPDPLSFIIGTGVATNFVYDGLKRAASAGIRELAPGAFRGSSMLLAEVDREFEDIKHAVLGKYPSIKTLETFLSPEKTIRGGVLNPLFEHIFLDKPLNRSALITNFRDCLAKGESITAGYIHSVSINEIIDDIIDTTKRVYLSNTRTSSFVLLSAVQEVQRAFHTISDLSSHFDATHSDFKSKQNDEVAIFCRDYLDSIKSYVREMIINGLDAVTKKERLRHILQEAYVPLTINHALQSRSDVEGADWRGNALRVVTSSHRTIIRGPAGSGKTTLLHWFITNCDPFGEGDSSEITDFPIYVPLRRLEGRQIT